MQHNVQMTWLLALALLFVAVMLRSEVLVPAGALQRVGPRPPRDEDEQLPETDRAPRRASHALAYTVALTAAVRLGLLLTLQR